MDLQGQVIAARADGQLMRVLQVLEREQWDRVDWAGQTFLHHACHGDNADAAVALLNHGLGVDDVTQALWTPAYIAALSGQPRVLEVLCVAGAHLSAETRTGETPLEAAVRKARPPYAVVGAIACARVLVTNGVRLATVCKEYHDFIWPELRALDRGVLACRAVVVALLGLKKSRRILPEIDRWVVRQVALACWVTRTDNSWSSASASCALL